MANVETQIGGDLSAGGPAQWLGERWRKEDWWAIWIGLGLASRSREQQRAGQNGSKPG